MRTLWNGDGDILYHQLSHACRSLADPLVLQCEIYLNVIEPAGKLLDIKEISPATYLDKQGLSEITLTTEGKLAILEQNRYPISSSYWQIKAANRTIWCALSLIPEGKGSKIQTLELKTPQLGRPLTSSQNIYNGLTRQFLELTAQKNFSAILERFVAPNQRNSKTTDNLLNALSDMVDTLKGYSLDALRFRGGQQWYEHTKHLTVCEYVLSNKEADFAFTISFDDNNYIHDLEFLE